MAIFMQGEGWKWWKEIFPEHVALNEVSSSTPLASTKNSCVLISPCRKDNGLNEAKPITSFCSL